MAADSLPHLLVSLTPIFFSSGASTPEVTALRVVLTLTGTPSLDPMLYYLVNDGAIKTIPYGNLSASDSTGPFPLTSYLDTNSSNAVRYWSATRQPVGDVVIRFLATPPAALGVGNGPRIDLRRDQGGVVGLGQGFIPRPAVDDEWNITVRWEGLDKFPWGMRAVSSLGEGAETTIQGRPGRVLDKTYFAVGNLSRWPPWEKRLEDGDGTGPFAMGFFGESQDSFRLFWRKAGMGYGGAGGFRSFLMEYTDLAAEELTTDDLENLVSHESVHGYALMNPVRQEDVWYREGVAVYYAVMAPFLAGAVDRKYFVRWMNNNAQSYYTGGTTGMDWKYVLDHYWTSTELVRTSYFRGFIYLAQVQGLISQATNGSKGLDDLVLSLYRRYKTDAVTQSEQFVSTLADYIGQTAADASFHNMTSGKLIIPEPGSLARFGLRMVRQDMEKLELGFSESSLGRNISGLIPGSRAEEAGLREGDEVVRFWTLSTAADSVENQMRVVVKRDGKEVVITYFPRSRDKVECYQWVDVLS
ncbi:protein lap1 [Echria macrotheca]|uniref:Protein lap1 n=1 Tax=Echria macrotheca TaxID=438768 RepID=A0AAJ0B2M2_9PEZI|nr:protein lap1 [Echria macrotheca]